MPAIRALPLAAALALGCQQLPSGDEAGALELRAYPAGFTTGVQYRKELDPDQEVFAVLAWNDTDRDDFGEHDHEEGGGPGLGAGWRHWFEGLRSGWLAGARADLWVMEIDWRDQRPGPRPARRGDTSIVVLQPVVEGGYAWELGEGWHLELTAGLGLELNVVESGEPVGEGPIGLIGLSLVLD